MPLILSAVIALVFACAVTSVFLMSAPASDNGTKTAERPSPPKLAPTAPSPSPRPLPPSVNLKLAANVVTERPKPAKVTRPAAKRVESVRPHRATSPRRSAALSYRNNPDCIGLGSHERARCMRPQVLAADQRMRGAYARAVRAGLSPSTLTSYQRRWTRLLRQADSDPHHVTAALGSMARELGEERQRQGARL